MSTIAERPTIATDLPLYRLHLMRAGYLLMGLGLAVVKWPLIVNDADSLPLFEGVVACLLTAITSSLSRLGAVDVASIGRCASDQAAGNSRDRITGWRSEAAQRHHRARLPQCVGMRLG
jgi:hypothetical protein